MTLRGGARPGMAGTGEARKVQENRLRRAAQRQGRVLSRCRRRDPLAIGYGLYRLDDGGWQTLDEVEAVLLAGVR